MKRSEMVKALMDLFTNTEPPDTDEECASTILLTLEKLGMKPPTIIVLPNSYNRAEGQMGFEANEWEAE